MQQQMDFNGINKIKLKQPITKKELLETMEQYFVYEMRDLESHISKPTLKATMELIKDIHDLDKAVEIINSNRLCDCEKEFTELIRKPYIITLTILVFHLVAD